MQGHILQYRNSRWVPAQHFAAGVGVCLATVNRWAAQGKIVTTKVGSLKLVRLDRDLIAFRALLGRIVQPSKDIDHSGG